MEWLNLRLSQLRAAEYLRSDPVERATWLQLLAFCCDQENGGLIPECASWKDRTWQQLCGVTQKEVSGKHHLWTWEGENLRVWGYPVEKEAIVRTKREAARNGGKASGIARRQTSIEPSASPNAKAHAEAYASPNAQAKGEPMLERKGIGKGKEEERKDSTTTTTPHESAPTPAASLSRGCTVEEAFAYADRFNGSTLAGFQIPRPVVTLWHDGRSAIGWVQVRDGTEIPIADWQADLRKFAQHYHRNDQTSAFRNGRGQADARPGSHPKAAREPDTVHTASTLPRL